MLAFDTETTGLDLYHGCLPYFFAFAHNNGSLEWVEWQVDPLTRLPVIKSEDLDCIVDLLCSDELLCHNANFDLRAMERLLAFAFQEIGYEYQIDWGWDGVHDTMIASHAWRNLWSHSLKELRLLLLWVDDAKQNALRHAVNTARGICRSKDFIQKHGVWRIADESDPHWPGIHRAPSESQEDVSGWWLCDTWLLKAIYDRAPEFLPDPDTCLVTEDNVFSAYDSSPSSYNYDLPQNNTKEYDYFNHPWRTVLRNYALEDVETTLPLWDFLPDALNREGLYSNYKERLRLAQVTYEMQSVGVNVLQGPLDRDLQRYQAESNERRLAAERIAKQKLGVDEFNIASPKQLRTLLFDKEGFGLPVLKKTKPSKTYPQGQDSTDDETLQKLEEIVTNEVDRQAMFFFRNLRFSRRATTAFNYLKSYAAWVTDDGRIHSSLNITGSKFTRQSSSDPNMQNIGTGKDNEQGDRDYNLREDFGPPPGYVWLAWDYSNIELRLWAWLCGNQELISAFEQNYSVHLLIARELHPSLVGLSDEDAQATMEYKKTKNGDFSILYGASERKANATYGVRNAFDKINKRLPEVRDFTQQLHNEVRERGWIETLTGYRLWIPTNEPHVAVSGKIQGTAGAIIGRAMIDCSDWLRENAPPVKLILQIHDELVFQAPKAFFLQNKNWLVDNLTCIMESQGDRIGVPTPVHGELITSNWSEGVPF